MAGFLPYSRASLTLDLIAVSMIAVIPMLVWSVYLVKVKRDYTRHKRVQLAITAGLLLVVAAFEWDMRLNGWRQYAWESRYYDTLVFPALYIHLCFAISTVILWVYTLQGAIRWFPKPPAPNAYSQRHKKVAGLAAIDLFCTAVTGWAFYLLAFVA